MSSSNWLLKGLDWGVSKLNGITPVYRWLFVVSASVLCFLVGLTVVDVILRYIFRVGWIRDTIGLTEMMLVVMLFLAIGYVQLHRGHIGMDLITSRLSPKGKIVIGIFTGFLSLCLFGVAIWKSFTEALHIMSVNAQTMVGLPYAPFAFIVPLGCTLLFLMILRDLLENLSSALKLRIRGSLWLLMLGGTALVIAGLILWMQPGLWSMNLTLVGISALVAVLLLIFLGMPCGFAMLLVCLVFMAHVTSVRGGLSMLGGVLFSSAATYDFGAVYFFMLMGCLVLASGLGKDLYYSAYRWMGHMSGGLAMATVGASAAFAATVGDSLPQVITFGKVALPEMKRYKYSDALATGCIMAGTTLGPLIPPSITFIIYGVLTGESIGKLFIAGIVPGILLSLAFIVIIYVQCRLNPKLGPPGERSGWVERLVSLKSSGPVLVLFLLVIGGIYGGAFCPLEGGAVGAFAVFIISLIMRRFNRQESLGAITDTARLSAAVFLMIIGSKALSYFVTASNFVAELSKFIAGAGLATIHIVIAIIILYLVLGCFMSVMTLIFVSIPIFYPLLTSLGVDGIWFGVVVLIACHVGVITPPYGLVLFTMRSVAKDVPLTTLFRGALPPVLATLVAITILIAFPQIVTWLPNLLF